MNERARSSRHSGQPIASAGRDDVNAYVTSRQGQMWPPLDMLTAAAALAGTDGTAAAA